MKIQDLFHRDIRRSINGVVKADQLDDSSVWQELDEFVVTKELNRHLSDLIEVLLTTMQAGEAATEKNGIWISGFFGCGKSHLIKVLSYLLENDEHTLGTEHRRAVEFFEDKFEDALLFADLKKIVASHTDTILFNIDSKADHRSGRDALLQVFLRVLNEKQGFSGDHPHIAHLERHLQEKGKLDVFHEAFERAAGSPWLEERDAWEFQRDHVVTALTEALGQSASSVEKWVDNADSHFSLTVENFAKWVKQYLDRQGSDHRIMFLVDEVGQFIGNDTHLMLNLQTITEQLGTVCEGRAWVVVTSQEDLDSVLGDLRSQKSHDFSKIQGRFKTRLSLSSANVDEVIQERLLKKNEASKNPLRAAYDGKHDILKNQLSFVKTGMTLRQYHDVDDFTAAYPFPAYQFTLVQKVFESIRKAGATGLHLSQGERSTLDAFQNAAKQIGEEEIGVLVPFYRFYPSVEGFLDTSVKRTIDQAGENHALQPFDSTVLKVLFLIRYIDELPGNVDNLVTLCVDQIDADRLALRRTIEDSLTRLEGETLVARNGDVYFFLTNEERDIGREIKNTPIPSGGEARELGELIFEDCLGEQRKHTFGKTGRDFTFNRMCDDHAVRNKLEGSLEVTVMSSMHDEYAYYHDDARCLAHVAPETGRVLIRLPDDTILGRELRTYLQTEAYVRTKHTGTLPETTKRILRERSEENRERRSRLLTSLRSLLSEADYYASGQKLEIGTGDPKVALSEALDYLIENSFSKMGYIQHLHPEPKREIQSTLRANDIEQLGLQIKTPEANPEALDDLRDYVRLCALTNKQIVLHDLIEKRYGARPYGWPELEVVLLVTRLAVLREIDLIVDSAPIPLDKAYDHLTLANKQRKVVIKQRETAATDLIKKAQTLGKELFAEQGPSAEEDLFQFLSKRLSNWDASLHEFETLAANGKYPGLDEIRTCRAALRKFVDENNSLRFLKRFAENRAELLECAEDYHELQGFYKNQKPSWEQLERAVNEFSQNRMQLEKHPEAGGALRRMEEIRDTPRPYGFLHEVANLVHTARQANDELVDEARKPAEAEIQRHLDQVEADFAKTKATEAQKSQATQELTQLLQTARTSPSIAHIAQAQGAAEGAFDRAVTELEKALTPAEVRETEPSPTPPPAPVVKKRRVIEVSGLYEGTFIETPAEAEMFLKKLSEQIQAAIDANERVQLR